MVFIFIEIVMNLRTWDVFFLELPKIVFSVAQLALISAF